MTTRHPRSGEGRGIRRGSGAGSRSRPNVLARSSARSSKSTAISVFWLREELRERRRVVSPPLPSANSRTTSRSACFELLGYRCPSRTPTKPITVRSLDAGLVDGDGSSPSCPAGRADGRARIRDRLERQFGDEGAEMFLRDFRKYVGAISRTGSAGLLQASCPAVQEPPDRLAPALTEGAFEASSSITDSPARRSSSSVLSTPAPGSPAQDRGRPGEEGSNDRLPPTFQVPGRGRRRRSVVSSKRLGRRRAPRSGSAAAGGRDRRPAVPAYAPDIDDG